MSIQLLRDIANSEKFDNQFEIKLFRQELLIEWLSQYTVSFYLSYIHSFIAKNPDIKVQDFWKIIFIKSSLNRLKELWLAQTTMIHYYNVLNKYCKFLLLMKVIEYNPITDIKKPRKPKKIPESLTEDKIDIIFNHLSSDIKCDSRDDFTKMRWYMIIYILLNSWIRRKELLNLTFDCIEWNKLFIKDWKWMKDRIVIVNNKTKNIINEWKNFLSKFSNNLKYVIPLDCKWQNKYTSDWLSWYFRRLSNVLWFKIYPHLLRHTYASLSILNWINIFTLKSQLWHSSLNTTQLYLSLTSDTMQKEIEDKFNFDY